MNSDELRELAKGFANDCEGKKKVRLLAAADELDRLKRVEKERSSFRPNNSFLRMG